MCKPQNNVDSLEDIIKDKGYKKGFIAQRLGITPNTLSAKLSDRRKWKITEIAVLCELLSIDNETRDRIFFENEVH